MNIGILKKAAEMIEGKQSLTIRQKAEQENVRAIELLWSTLVQKYYQHHPPTFTGMERQAIRNLVTGYGIRNLLLYLSETVKTWNTLKHNQEFSSFPQVPTFQIFLRFHRLITPLIDLNKIRQLEEKEKVIAKQKEDQEKRDYRPPISLSKMVENYKKNH